MRRRGNKPPNRRTSALFAAALLAGMAGAATHGSAISQMQSGSAAASSTRPAAPAAVTPASPLREEAVLNQEPDSLTADTDRLFALATELKREVARTNQDTLSIQVIKKADEIEKLAKNMREKMKAQ